MSSSDEDEVVLEPYEVALAVETGFPPAVAEAIHHSQPAAPKRETDKYHYGVGLLVHNHTSSSIDSWCLSCGLAKNAKYRAKPGAKALAGRCQGRPLGAHFAFLKDCPGEAKAHARLWCEEHIPWRLRADMRREFAHKYPELSKLERDPTDVDDEGEPRVLS